MWRAEGKGELYTYLPPGLKGNANVCKGTCNPTYGQSIGTGNFHFKPGEWTVISQRLRLNDVGKANGEIEVFAGGESVISLSGVTLRQSGAGRIRGIQMQSFFGGDSFIIGCRRVLILLSVGHTAAWASPKDQYVYFADFSVGIVSTLEDSEE